MGKLGLRPTRRDALVAVAGMACVFLFSRMFDLGAYDPSVHYVHTPDALAAQKHWTNSNSNYKHHVVQHDDIPAPAPIPLIPKHGSHDTHPPVLRPVNNVQKKDIWPDLSSGLPKSKLVKHGAGWTIFENVYMSNGTLYLITENPSDWPQRRMIIDTGITALNTLENIAAREPTEYDLDWISPKEAEARWGKRIWPVPEFTILYWDPLQFINHYYHFAAELLMGTWRMLASYDSHISPNGGHTKIPTPARAVFPHVEPKVWRDGPSFNQFFLHAVWPSIGLEFADAWADRVKLTKSSIPSEPSNTAPHAFLYEKVLLADRSASFRGQHCSSNARTVSEAIEATRGDLEEGPGVDKGRWWWEPFRRRVLKMASVDEAIQDLSLWWHGTEADVARLSQTLPGGRPAVHITYISRQTAGRRKLIQADHEALVQALKDLVQRKNAEARTGSPASRQWELEIVEAEHISREEQIRIAARTTVMLGVHGNGLTHLIMMPLTPLATVIEMFYPGGFARDYQWTSTALGMRHYGVQNDTAFTEPKLPSVDYPEGFQGNAIPVYGPFVAKLIEERVDGVAVKSL
ncbi:hypothetical protein CTheo_4717 [Ceratobasidium theobromae]|uniref:Glycosyltransferase 61 catalytic domain-containing protein n=1 Tax=Ceratobasidium theobromae TaxID=1582974 RepID=A0A5N5QJC5_9AGAM|nr:hypothetical protein CTheo_4717 [Ceratobasidium theobromae]